MKNTRLRGTLMRMLAAKEMRLEGLGRHPLSDGAISFITGEAAALKEALVRLELFDQERFDNVREKIRLDWSEAP